ncbi:uroporphyrinogen-III synthase [Brachybacterium sp. FME24]|uniref:uroporphyrinogen-III synthase n=1 Tax=Brachybacterium sp. FME24 TaxID=2742605 RepID=UPI001D0410ED|nr:uroporphyrinogen-III synthase [Brachybacterium sp. FME24]
MPSRPVLVTRPAERGDALMSRLEELGIPVEHRPQIRLVPETGGELASALESLAAGAFTHLVVTSRSAVDAMGPVAVPPATQIVAVGEGTAAALAAAGIPADLVAAGSGAAVVEAMPDADRGASVLFPASAAASATVPEGLAAKGYRVHRVTAYRPELLELPAATIRTLTGGGYAAIVLTSPMIARAAAGIGVHESTAVVTIGAPTSDAARGAGMRVAVQAEEPTDEALARAVQAALASPPGAGPAVPAPSDP